MGLEGYAGAAGAEAVGLPQHDAVSQQLEEHVVVARQHETQRQRVVPALGAQQRVELVENHAGHDADQQVQHPQRLVEQELREGESVKKEKKNNESLGNPKYEAQVLPFKEAKRTQSSPSGTVQ